jgi:hypothetical protein
MKSRAILGVGMLCAALVACQHAPAPTATEPPSTPLAEAEATQPQPPKPPRKPPVPPAPATDAASPAEIAPSAAPPEEIAKVEPTPPRSPLKLKAESLIGLDQPSTAALLGEPSERSEAAPATIWRYAAGRSCQLEIYFYLDLKSQVMRALHYEVKTNEAAEPARSQCFADLLAQHESNSVPGTSPSN